MNIQTKYLGELEITDKQIVQFSSGLPGFLDEKEFVLLDIPGNPIFQFLQSVHSKDLVFVVTNPYHFYKGYRFELDETTIDALQIESEKDVVVLTIVTLKDPFDASTINLKAPLIINQHKLLGKQYILNSDEYDSKAFIQPPSAEKGV
ncbi:flagellar assembly protein FliW [Paucisalibacillus sp. EB02]|uniref:flagellar assembly protein FliW n=1 Tax=Paucisalibacillus sp. EB02 TaxID=1347087 RepID=UPI0004BBE1CB|nr:flagellar assembly protein FliW [Paucisalibacillus sp. EB02]